MCLSSLHEGALGEPLERNLVWQLMRIVCSGKGILARNGQSRKVAANRPLPRRSNGRQARRRIHLRAQ